MVEGRVKKFVPIVPGIFTVGNMIAGFVSILHSASGKTVSGAWLIILGGVFDLLDGKIARLTHSTSEIGVELDSFADFLTFGVAPGILLFSLDIYSLKKWGFLIPVLFLLAGAFRLARYNVTATHQVKSDFQGLPIPLAAVFVSSYIIFTEDIWGVIRFPHLFTPALILLSWLMISNVRYSARPKLLTIRKLGWRTIVLAIPVGAVLLKPRWFLFPLIGLYIIHGFIREIHWTALRSSKEDNNELQN